MSSLPQINIFARTTQASQKLSQAGQTQNFLTSALPIKWSNNQLLQGPSFESLGAVWAGDWVTDTYATDVANSLIGVKIYETYNSPDPEGGGAVTYVTYGDALWKWMQNQQNNGCSDIFQVKGNENSSYVNPFSGSCISPQTVIATASGDRPIHSLGANDKILIRAAQEFGILSDEKVQQDITPVGFRNKRAFVNLYGFNGEDLLSLPAISFLHSLVQRQSSRGLHVSRILGYMLGNSLKETSFSSSTRVRPTMIRLRSSQSLVSLQSAILFMGCILRAVALVAAGTMRTVIGSAKTILKSRFRPCKAVSKR